jgi:tRNA modification GTPase
LGGRLSTEIGDVRARLLDQLAYLSARADFPDEDVPPADISPQLELAADALDALLETANSGMLYRQGARVTIAGLPNVGKSSLMNRLLRENRAIVTPYAGTTRDTLSETINLGGLPVVLTDTAGLESTRDPIESLGIDRAHEAMKHSNLLLIVLESGRELRQEEERLLAETKDRPRILALNKSDLGPPAEPKPAGSVAVSALTGEGIPELEERLRAELLQGRIIGSDSAIVTNPRHYAALVRAREHLRQAQEALAASIPEDLASADLRASIDALGEITGVSITEDLLDSIFRNFCIGK